MHRVTIIGVVHELASDGQNRGGCLLSPLSATAFMSHIEERNAEATIFVGDLDRRVDENLLWELMLQAGPVGMCYRCHPL